MIRTSEPWIEDLVCVYLPIKEPRTRAWHVWRGGEHQRLYPPEAAEWRREGISHADCSQLTIRVYSTNDLSVAEDAR